MNAPITLAEPIPVGQEEVIGPTLLKYISELQRQAANAEALRLQLSRAKEWMQHKPRCGIETWANCDKQTDRCTCGLNEFLKEVVGEGK